MKDKKKKHKSSKAKDKKQQKDEIEELREQIEKVQQEKEDLFEKLQRVSADYSNFQKRVPKQITDSIAYEKESILRTLLPALDNFEHVLGNAESSEKTEAVIKGIEIIYKQLLDILKSHGVEQVNAVGSSFDPSMHEAMLQRTDKEKEEGIVLEEFQKGYKLNDRVIRPNKVVVNTLSAQQDSADEADEGEDAQEEQKQEDENKSESD